MPDNPPPICRRCFRTEDDHHAFEPVRIPAGCKCDPRDWKTLGLLEMTAVCARWDGDTFGLCLTCSHLEECHA